MGILWAHTGAMVCTVLSPFEGRLFTGLSHNQLASKFSEQSVQEMVYSRQASHMALWFLFLECDCCSYSACSILGKFVSLFPRLTTHG